jgi:tRNA-Thr(GGU) m(6)t(6)A37 methyltransferase TsaA
MQTITLRPIGVVRSPITGDKEDFWGDVQSTIELDSERFGPEALRGLEDHSHVEVIFHFHKFGEDSVTMGTRHPRGNPDWPEVGIFAQRAKARPNRIGATICRVMRVDGLKLTVSGLDAFDGTPVLDIKPVLAEFLPEKSEVRQAAWSRELMRNYFARTESGTKKP